ncbi:hypothetical protein Tdes44962_MAKER01846 [Teratosphaeria destructans]|uniref:Pathogen-related protein n=1 Tax=Teratosphaeria destructans TaxID=418781 RepID=A0A9W7W4S9_9PEZI|nr:hypothetical protein Tdes44962_MAKER01846 [Teratosphaeria destructans]
MAVPDTQLPPAEPSPAIPDYLASPNAVFADQGVQWRYGKAPDYSKTRKVWEEGIIPPRLTCKRLRKKMNHEAGSLPQLVENLVKNWEVEASFKPRLEDWRTIDHEKYTFAINGGTPQTAQHMLKVGTYNAIIAPNEYYSPENSDFASSHKTFKRMMPTFAWEVVEVYSGPPTVAFKWRHWGVMKNDYVGFNNKGEKIVAKAHGGPIEIFGVTVATVDDKVRLQAVDTWMDSLDMFRQIAPNGVVNKEAMNRNVSLESALDVHEEFVPADASTPSTQDMAHGRGETTGDAANVSPAMATQQPHEHGVPQPDGVKIAEQFNKAGAQQQPAPEDVIPKHISNSTGEAADAFVPHQGADTSIKAVGHDDTAVASASQTVVDTAATQRAHAELGHTPTNFHAAHEHVPHPDPAASQGLTTEPVAADAEDARAVDVTSERQDSRAARAMNSSSVSGDVDDRVRLGQSGDMMDEQRQYGTYDAVDQHLEKPAGEVHPHPHHAVEEMQPQPGEAVAVPATAEETVMTHEEMSRITPSECPFMMNRE